MSVLPLKPSLPRAGWIALTRREIGYGLQFFAVGLVIGNFLGVGFGQLTDEVFWIQLILTGLLLLGSWLVRFKAGEAIWIQPVVIGLILLLMWMLFRRIHGH